MSTTSPPHITAAITSTGTSGADHRSSRSATSRSKGSSGSATGPLTAGRQVDGAHGEGLAELGEDLVEELLSVRRVRDQNDTAGKTGERGEERSSPGQPREQWEERTVEDTWDK